MQRFLIAALGDAVYVAGGEDSPRQVCRFRPDAK
jgi:hypothetical protein